MRAGLAYGVADATVPRIGDGAARRPAERQATTARRHRHGDRQVPIDGDGDGDQAAQDDAVERALLRSCAGRRSRRRASRRASRRGRAGPLRGAAARRVAAGRCRRSVSVAHSGPARDEPRTATPPASTTSAPSPAAAVVPPGERAGAAGAARGQPPGSATAVVGGRRSAQACRAPRALAHAATSAAEPAAVRRSMQTAAGERGAAERVGGRGNEDARGRSPHGPPHPCSSSATTGTRPRRTRAPSRSRTSCRGPGSCRPTAGGTRRRVRCVTGAVDRYLLTGKVPAAARSARVTCSRSRPRTPRAGRRRRRRRCRRSCRRCRGPHRGPDGLRPPRAPSGAVGPAGSSASHASTPARSRARMAVDARLARTDDRARSARARSSRPCTSRATSYWSSRRERNSSGSSAPSATVAPASTSARSGTSAAVAYTPRETFDAGHTSSATPCLDDPVEHARVLGGPHAVPEPVGRAGGRATSATCAGPSSSPPCGTEASPARRAIANAGPNSSVLAAPLVVRQAEPDDLAGAVARRAAPPAAPASARPAGAASATPRRRRRPRRPVAALAARASSSTISSAGVSPPTNGAYDVGSTWISSRPDPSAASSAAASRDDPPHVGLAAHARARGVVQALEPEPAALVGGHPQRVVVEQRVRQPDAVRRGEVGERRDPHRPGEVQVQVRLREQGQVAHAGQCASRAGCGGARPRVGRRVDQPVPDAADRVEVLRAELAAQVPHVHVDDVGARGRSRSPTPRESSCSRVRTSPGLRRNVSASANSRADRSTSRSSTRMRRVRRSSARRPSDSTCASRDRRLGAQPQPDPGEQLLEPERLGHVVVRPGLQARDRVGDGRARP